MVVRITIMGCNDPCVAENPKAQPESSNLSKIFRNTKETLPDIFYCYKQKNLIMFIEKQRLGLTGIHNYHRQSE